MVNRERFSRGTGCWIVYYCRMEDEKNIIENSKIVNSKNVKKLNYHLMMI